MTDDNHALAIIFSPPYGGKGAGKGANMKQSDADVDAFIASLPEDVRDDMRTLDREISVVMAGEPRTLWVGKFWAGSDQEIIGYGSLIQPRSDKKDVRWFLIGLALQKNYISVYVNAVEDRQYLPEKYGADLGKVKVGKASISFKRVDDIALDKLVSLLSRAKQVTEVRPGT